MKIKAVAAFWAVAVSIVLFLSPLMTAKANAQLFDRSLSLSSLSSELTTPDKIAKYMWRHFEFENDRRQFGTEEYWQTPDQFLLTRKGDCEDFAVFAKQALKLNGTNAFVLNIYGKGYGHTVCVFEENGVYNVIDRNRVVRYKAKNMKELAHKIYPFWNYAAIVMPSETSHEGLILSKIMR